jgi:acyl carrier protein
MKPVEEMLRNFIAENILFSDNGYPYLEDDSFLEKGILDSTNILELVMFLRDKNQNDFDLLISRGLCYIRTIPKEFQTLKMSLDCVEYYKPLLECCYCIDLSVLNSIFKSKSNTHIPKKERFNFIINFNEDALIRILKVRSNLLSILPLDKQTDKLIKEVLQSDGYALQYVINPSKEHIEIALDQQPKAIKYVKTL